MAVSILSPVSTHTWEGGKKGGREGRVRVGV